MVAFKRAVGITMNVITCVKNIFRIDSDLTLTKPSRDNVAKSREYKNVNFGGNSIRDISFGSMRGNELGRNEPILIHVVNRRQRDRREFTRVRVLFARYDIRRGILREKSRYRKSQRIEDWFARRSIT